MPRREHRPSAWMAGALGTGSLFALGAACASIVGFESEYHVVSADAGTDVIAAGGQGGAGGGNGSGAMGGSGGMARPCAHALCEIGDALDAACDPCVAQVCDGASYCCDTIWDPACIADAQTKCDVSCCGDGYCAGIDNTCGMCPGDCTPCTCAHSPCEVGAPLSTTGCKETCVASVCAELPECCSTGMAFLATECIEKADELCSPDPCVEAVCMDQPSCCTTSWDQTCVDAAKTSCGLQCNCVHSVCQVGVALTATCDPCVEAVCQWDNYCCSGAWDEICRHEVTAICGLSC